MFRKITITASLLLLTSIVALAQTADNIINADNNSFGLFIFALIIIVPLLFIIGKLYFDFKLQLKESNEWKKEGTALKFSQYIKNFDRAQIHAFVKLKKKKKCCGKCKGDGGCGINKKALGLIAALFLFAENIFAQAPKDTKALTSQPGIIITIVLLLIPILLAVAFALSKANNAIKNYANANKKKEAGQFADYIKDMDDDAIEEAFTKKDNLPVYSLRNNELSGNEKAEDTKGLLSNISDKHETHFTASKRKAVIRPTLDADITKLILWYFGCATFWLVMGTGIGEYLGIKFVAPDSDHISWLSFGRLRPVHTNIVFWGWASLAMIGLGYYVVPTVSNTKIYSIKFGWIALVCTNIMVIAGSIALMSGIINGGGEFREYIWPIMAFFAVALILTFINFFMTVAKRTTKEIYISNWFILSALLFTIIDALTAYLPFWQ
ncbi:MAG: cbb3-type cytochrome c oxidase subunit I, partial [Ferruginibacter sp.]|nr:cbb3-type cytochrome c oxidase subunit I [Ferruginibacter sp.]